MPAQLIITTKSVLFRPTKGFSVIRSVPEVYVKIPAKFNSLISVRCFAAVYLFFGFLWYDFPALIFLLFSHEKTQQTSSFLFMMLYENIFPLLLENSFNAPSLEIQKKLLFLWLVLTYSMLFRMGTVLTSNEKNFHSNMHAFFIQ